MLLPFEYCAFPVSSAASSEAGEKNKSLSLAEPAGFAETATIKNSARLRFLLLEYYAFPVSSAASSEAGERKKTLSLAEPAGFAETTRNRKSCKTMFFPF